MSFEAQLIVPESDRSVQDDRIAVYIPGIDSTIQNTGNRVQAMADLVGVPILMTDVLPQGKPTISELDDMPTAAANQPDGDIYTKLSRTRGDFIRDRLSKVGRDDEPVLLMADSLGVPLAQGIQLHADGIDRFDALLLRDGWNLGRSDNKNRGFLRYGSYQARNIIHDLGRKMTGKGLEVEDLGWENYPNWPREYGLVGIAKDAADIMRSHTTKQNAIELAGRAAAQGFGMNVVCLREGLSGTPLQQDIFIGQLESSYLARNRADSPNRFHAESVAGWHSDLLDPVRGAHDMEQTLDLIV